MPSHKPILYFLLALALARGIIYASVVPPWQSPDEPAHFERTRAALTAVEWNSTAKNGPAWYDELRDSLFTFQFFNYLFQQRYNDAPGGPLNQYIGLYQEIYGGLYGSRPAYAIIGWPLFLARHQPITLQLYLVRLNTVLMNVGLILLAYLITRTIFPNNTFLTLGVPILILFNPQHTHMLSTINSGNLAELLATMALYFMVKGIIKDFSWLDVIAILGLSLAAMWTKATAFFLPFVIGTIGLFYLWRYRRQWRRLLPTTLILAGLSYYFAPERLQVTMFEGWAYLKTGDFYLYPMVPLDLFRSFWAMPGWLILRLHPFWYQLLAMACLLALVGLIMLFVSRRPLLFSARYQPQIQTLATLAVAVIVSIGILLARNALSKATFYSQGRSIYPVIVPISLFLMLGWRQLIPLNWRSVGLLGITLALFLFDALVLFHYMIPFFYSRY